MASLYCWVTVAEQQLYPFLFSTMCSTTQTMNTYHFSIRIRLVLRPNRKGAPKMQREGMQHGIGVNKLKSPKIICLWYVIVRRWHLEHYSIIVWRQSYRLNSSWVSKKAWKWIMWTWLRRKANLVCCCNSKFHVQNFQLEGFSKFLLHLDT